VKSWPLLEMEAFQIIGPLVTGTVAFAAFVWAVRWHFRAGPMAIGMKAVSIVSAAGFCAFVVEILSSRPGHTGFALAGIVLHLAALVLFLWCVDASRCAKPPLAFSADEPDSLIQVGPYGLARHPFYVCYIIYWIGSSIAARSAVCGAFALLLTGLYVAAAQAEEQRFRTSRLAEKYADYSRKVGMFWPKLGLARS
jgi:protein-S-isoprenylcysteine O-methyltransferase Ste14